MGIDEKSFSLGSTRQRGKGIVPTQRQHPGGFHIGEWCNHPFNRTNDTKPSAHHLHACNDEEEKPWKEGPVFTRPVKKKKKRKKTASLGYSHPHPGKRSTEHNGAPTLVPSSQQGWITSKKKQHRQKTIRCVDIDQRTKDKTKGVGIQTSLQSQIQGRNTTGGNRRQRSKPRSCRITKVRCHAEIRQDKAQNRRNNVRSHPEQACKVRLEKIRDPTLAGDPRGFA